MKQDRFLTGILVGIAVLVIVALAVFFTRQDSQTYIAEDTPDGVVHNFFFAIQQEDYERAYSYLPEGEDKPSLSEFMANLSQDKNRMVGVGVQIDDTEIFDNADGSQEAIVDIVIIHPSNGPFDTGYRSYETVTLVEQNGEWKIKHMTTWYWWDWYPERIPQG